MNALPLSLLAAGLIAFGASNASPADKGLPSRVTRHAKPPSEPARPPCSSIAIARVADDGTPMQAELDTHVEFAPAIAVTSAGTVVAGEPMVTRGLAQLPTATGADARGAVYARTLTVADDQAVLATYVPAQAVEGIAVNCIEERFYPAATQAPRAKTRPN